MKRRHHGDEGTGRKDYCGLQGEVEEFKMMERIGLEFMVFRESIESYRGFESLNRMTQMTPGSPEARSR